MFYAPSNNLQALETGTEHGSVLAPSARCHDGGRHGGAVVDLLARPASGAGYLHVPCRLFGRPVAFLELCSQFVLISAARCRFLCVVRGIYNGSAGDAVR